MPVLRGHRSRRPPAEGKVLVPSAVRQGLVAALRCDGGAAGLIDAVQGLRIPAVAGVKWAPGQVGGSAASFDGTTGRYAAGAFPALNFPGNMTAMLVVNSPSLATLAVQRIACDTSSGNTRQFSLDIGRFAAAASFIWAGTAVTTTAAVLKNSTWYVLTFVRWGVSGAWTGDIYIDGLLSKRGTTATDPTATPSNFMIGASDAQSNFLNGQLETLLLWNRPLSPQEILWMSRDTTLPFRRTPPSLITYTFSSGITFDAASNSGYQTLGTSYSWNHTCAGSNRFLAVDVALLSLAGVSVSSVTYNGVNLSLVGLQTSGTGAVRTESWGLVAPATGTNSIVVTFSGSIGAGGSAGTAVSYTGVHQTSPTEAFTGATATNVGAADATVTITTVAANDWVHVAVASDDATITAGQTSRSNVTGVLGSGADEDTGPKATPGAQAMSYTNVAALATWAIAGYAIRPTAASSLAQTLTVTSGLLAWLAQTSRLTRTLSTSPGLLPWQAPAPLGRRTLLASPGLEAWQMRAPALLSRLLTTPAQELWNPPAPLGSRLLRVSPGQDAWLVSTPTTRYVLTPAPSSEAWQVASALLHRRLLVTPSLEVWQDATARMTAALLSMPAALAWLAVTPRQTRALSVTATQELWNAQTPLESVRLLVTPGRAAWLAVSPALRYVLTPPAASEVWLVATPFGSMRLAVAPSRMEWFTSSAIVGGVRVVMVSPAQMLWHPETELLLRRLLVTPGQDAWLARAGSLLQALRVSPGQIAWQGQTPAQSRRLQVQASRMAWQAALPQLLNALLILPSRMAWKPGTPILPAQQQLVVVLPAREAWVPGALVGQGPHTVIVTPAQMAWLAQQAILTQTGAPFMRRAVPVILSIQERNGILELHIETMNTPITLGFV